MLFGALVAFAGIYIGALRYGCHPAVALISVVGQESKAEGRAISVMAINTGRTPLVYHGSPPFAEIRVETIGGWTNMSQTYVSRGASFGILLPGKSLSYRFTVPLDVTRVKVGCFFETAGAKSWAAGRLLEAGWWNWVHRVSGFILLLLPDGPRQDVEFWSPETKIN